MSHFKIRTLLLISALFLSQTLWAESGKKVSSVTEGRPAGVHVLTEDTFVPVQEEKLARAQVWFVDYEWHRRHGVEVPPEGLGSSEFRQQVLDAYAWQTRGADDPADAFTGEKRLADADFYGGYGMGVNFGSGRAAANGLVQTKGVRTPMAKSTDPFHSNGAVQTIEAADEAIWSQILDAEMSHGSNKVVAVLLTGTYGKMKNGQIFPRALIIREMAVRPAHFMRNPSREFEADSARVQKALSHLTEALPYPKGYVATGNAADIHAGFYELMNREATAQAEYYAKRIYFGSVSPSNLELSGRRLDLGDHTAQLGYTKIFRLDDDSPFGETEEMKIMLNDFRGSLEKTLPPRLAAGLPSKNQLYDDFEKLFVEKRAVEMVRLTGAPHELIQAMANEGVLRELGAILVKVSKAGNDTKVFMEPAGYKNTSLYDLPAILKALGAQSDASAEVLEQVLSVSIADASLRREFAQKYAEFSRALLARAKAQGLSDVALSTYVREASQARNRTRTNLIRGDRRWKQLWETTDRGIAQGGQVVERYIYEQKALAIFNFKDAGPFQVVLSQQAREAEGTTLRRVFDAKSGSYTNILRLSATGDSVRLNGRTLKLDPLASADAKTDAAFEIVDSQGLIRRGALRDGVVEFTLGDSARVKISDLQLRRSGEALLTKTIPRPAAPAARSCEGLFL